MRTLDEVLEAIKTQSGLKLCSRKKDDRWEVPIDLYQEIIHYLQEYRERKENYEDATERHHAAYRILEARMKWKAAKLFEDDNPALSWEQLKQMEGKPVWLECEYFFCPQWVILTNVYDEKAMFIGDRIVDSELKEEMGDVWQAFRKERQ